MKHTRGTGHRFLTLITGLILLSGVCASYGANSVWRGGSAYSHFGVGLPNDYRSSYADGMGILGVAVHDPWLSGISNPALWSQTRFTNAGGMFEIRSLESSGSGREYNATHFKSGPFQLVVPINRERMGASFSISPLTSARYSLSTRGVLPAESNHLDQDLHFTVDHSGSGGMNRIEAGFGLRVTSYLSVGYAPSLILGVIRRDQVIRYDHSDYRSQNLEELTSHYGFGNRFGIYMHGRNMLRNNDQAAFGAVVSLPVSLVSERKQETLIDNRNITVRSASDYGSGKASLPLEVAAGISYRPDSRWLMSMDMLYQNWSDHKNFAGSKERFLKDRMRWGIGGQFAGTRSPAAAFFSRIIYRFGLSYDTGSLVVNDNNIETLTFHTGMGIPSSRSSSSIDINAEYGFRGTESSDLMQERIFALKISFNLSELMFIRRLAQ